MAAAGVAAGRTANHTQYTSWMHRAFSAAATTRAQHAPAAMQNTPRRVSAKEAAQIDEKLMGAVADGGYGFELQQAMELAGLACAEATDHAFASLASKSALIACGPGNNGAHCFPSQQVEVLSSENYNLLSLTWSQSLSYLDVPCNTQH